MRQALGLIETRGLVALFESAAVGFPASSPSDHQPWLMLIGQNGLGKSSLLKAAALPFMWPEERRAFFALW